MTLSAIRTDVQANWPTGYHASDLTDAKVNEFLNKAQREICRRHNFKFMEQEVTRSTVDAQRSYSVPTAGDSNWTEINSATVRKYKSEISCELINTNSHRILLDKFRKSDLERRQEFHDTSDSGEPQAYCISSDYIELWEKPNHASNGATAWTINFEFHGYLADLSADGDTNEIVSQYPLALEYLATSFGFKFGFDYEQAEHWKGLFEGIFSGMLLEDETERSSAVKDGMRPVLGQSLGGDNRVYRNLTAHYE